MIRTSIKGIDLSFKTSRDVFSPDAIDRGTLAMLSVVEFHPDDRVLDLDFEYARQRPDRALIKDEWINFVIQYPKETEIQPMQKAAWLITVICLR